MGLFKRAHLRGMAHELTRQGYVTWPSKEAEEAAADEIADDMSDEEMPEVSDQEGLSPEQASGALGRIVDVAEEIAAKTGGARDEGVNKVAAETTYENAASGAAVSLMQKSAEETAVATGPDVPGTTAPTPDLGATAEAEIDAVKVPSSGILGPMGTTEVNTKPGAIGQEARRPDQPGGEDTPPSGEVAKTAEPVLKTLEAMLNKMAMAEEKKEEREEPNGDSKVPPFFAKKKKGKEGDKKKKDDDDDEEKKKEAQLKTAVSIIKEAMDGASLSGGSAAGPPPTPRLDLDDNLLIPGVVAPGQGQTSQDVPAAAHIGVTRPQPAGTPGPTAPTQNQPAIDARVKSAMDVLNQSEEGRQLLHKLSQHAVYSQQVEAQKGAAFGQALQGVAAALSR